MAEQTRRELIEAAFDAAEQEGKDEVLEPGTDSEVVEPNDSVEAADSDDALQVDHDQGKEEIDGVLQKEKKADEALPGKAGRGKEAAEAKLIPGAKGEDKQPKVSDEEAQQRAGAPPIAWKPEEKAAWATLPQNVREAVTRREVETQRALTYSANARKFANEFFEATKPFEHLIAAQNSTPLKAYVSMMRTAAGLMTGNPQQKAALVAQIITGYGVDPEILDTTLSAALKNPNVQMGAQNLPPHVLQMLKPILETNRRFQEREQQEAIELQSKAEETIEGMRADTTKYPFLDEVRNDMADIMEVAAKRGKFLSLDAAYSMAVRLDPKYAKAAEQRQKGTEVSAAAATLARARQRRSTTVGAPRSGTGAVKTPTTRREAIEQAWEQASGG